MTSSNLPRSSGLWFLASVITSLGALGGSIAAGEVSKLTLSKWLYCICIGLALSLIFYFLLHGIGVLVRTYLRRRNSVIESHPNYFEKSTLTKLIYFCLIPCFLFFDWIGYSLNKILFHALL